MSAPRYKQAMKHIVDVAPSSLLKTQLVKLLYLADLEWYRCTGEQITELRYIWGHFGPWDQRIEDALAEMEGHDLQCSWRGRLRDGESYCVVTPGPSPRISVELPPAMAEVIESTVRAYSRVPLETLLADIVYETAPMKAAQRGQPLPMDAEPRVSPVDWECVADVISHVPVDT